MTARMMPRTRLAGHNWLLEGAPGDEIPTEGCDP